MKLTAGLTASGIIGWLLLEALKILMVPVTAWVMAMLALALKAVLMLVAVGLAIGVGVFFYRRSQAASVDAEV